MSNSADASHATARSEYRITIFQRFEPQGGETWNVRLPLFSTIEE
jgi:hypothetical protein